MTIRPQAPSYLDIPYSAGDVMNGVPVPPPAPAVVQKQEAQDTERRVPRRAPLISEIAEEKPLPADQEDALFQAADKTYRIALARIKFHETQLRRWRAIGQSFAALQAVDPQTAAVPGANVGEELLSLLKQIPEGQS